MEIFLDVWAEDSLSGEKTKCNEAIYTFVAVNNMGRPVKGSLELNLKQNLKKLRYDGALTKKTISINS